LREKIRIEQKGLQQIKAYKIFKHQQSIIGEWMTRKFKIRSKNKMLERETLVQSKEKKLKGF